MGNWEVQSPFKKNTVLNQEPPVKYDWGLNNLEMRMLIEHEMIKNTKSFDYLIINCDGFFLSSVAKGGLCHEPFIFLWFFGIFKAVLASQPWPLLYFVWTEEYCQTSPNRNKSPNLWHVTSILVCYIFGIAPVWGSSPQPG